MKDIHDYRAWTEQDHADLVRMLRDEKLPIDKVAHRLGRMGIIDEVKERAERYGLKYKEKHRTKVELK